MKRIFSLSLLLLIAANVQSESPKVKVTGGRVNIRSRPSLSGELMGQVMVNDELILAGQTNGDFVAIVAPEWVECWLANEYLQDGIVLPPKLNVRAGPNMNYGVVAVATRGDKLEVIQELDEWVKVKAPTNALAWISASFIAPIGGAEPVEKVATISPSIAPSTPTNVVVSADGKPVVKPEVKPEKKPAVVERDMAWAYDNMVAETEPILPIIPVEPKLGPMIPIVFELDSKREQGEPFSATGTLRSSRSVYIFRLVGDDGRTNCFIRGNKEQMRKLLDQPLRIEGKHYFYKRMDLPMVVPTKLVKLRG